MSIDTGELVGLIGPNGAGKTTIFNLLTGVYAPSSGEINILRDGIRYSVGGRKPWNLSKLGIARTFQNIRLFRDLSVLDNVRIAMHNETKYGLWSSFVHSSKYFSEEEKTKAKALELLDIFSLSSRAEEVAGSLPYGEQRHLEIVRAIATNPVLLLLDEPAAGMNHSETGSLTQTIAKIRKDYELTILLIEHDMSLVMNICEKIYVLDYGELIASGTPKEVQESERVITAYLGEDMAKQKKH
jgi:branched-chain amino acid transport system ATP-binding protein